MEPVRPIRIIFVGWRGSVGSRGRGSSGMMWSWVLRSEVMLVALWIFHWFEGGFKIRE